MTDYRFGVFIGNLGRLTLVALPIASVAIVVREAMTVRMHYSAVGSFFLVYLTTFLPLAIGGVLHNAIVFSLPRRWPVAMKRVTAWGTSPVVLFLHLVVLAAPALLVREVLPILLGLTVYGVLYRIPTDDTSPEVTVEQASDPGGAT